MSRHQNGYPWPSLTTPPYHPLLLAGLQGYNPYQHRAAICTIELVILPLLGHVKGSTGVITYELVPTSPAVSCMSGSSDLVFVMGGKWPYSCCFVCAASSTCSVLLATFLCSCYQAFFSIHLVSVHVVHPYSSIDTTAAWKKLRFILSVRSHFHMTDSQLDSCPCLY